MPDVFISYSREYRDAAIWLSEELRQYALETWFDIELRAGTIFADAIQERLAAARSVVVLWTSEALRKGVKGWVYSEADWAREHGKLIQAKLEDVVLHPPFFTSELPPVDLKGLTGRHPQISSSSAHELLRRIGLLTDRPGLASFATARSADKSLLAWERKYPNDKLVKLNGSMFQEARMRRARTKGLGNELRSLAEEIRSTPLNGIGLSSTGVIAFRQDVAELWPRSASAFAALGLDVNVYGLEFYDLSVERAFDGPTPILLVSGEVRNISRDDKCVPPVRVSLRDTRSQEIFDLVNTVTDQPLTAGESVSFQIRVENPPADAVDLETTFASFWEMSVADSLPRISPEAATAAEHVEEPLTLDQPIDEHSATTSALEPVAGLRFTNG